MYKMNSGSLTRGAWFEPESQGFALQERDSSSTITLGPDDQEIAFTDWILDDDWPEGNYVWRVKSIDDQDNTETRTIGLEHVIKMLDDRKLHDEVTTKTLAGNNSATTVTAKKAVQYLLGLQSVWELGDFEYNVSNPYEFSAGESIYDAIQTITETLEDAVWEYSLDVFPFKLHIRQRDNTVACEMRGGRNLATMKRSVSRSGMYTRIYPIGKNDLHIDGNYLKKNENLYGRIDKVETDQSKTTKANLQAWAQARLNRHCEPTMTISISGLELSAETGEDLDRLKLNKICLCPLPKSGIQISERIVKLQWRDRRKEPENVTVNLCNSSADVASIIKESSRGGGKAAAGQAKQNYLFEANEEHLYYEVFDDCGHLHSVLEMTEQSLRIAFDNEIASTRSEFLMTSESLRIKFENDLASTRSEFQMTSESLRIKFENDLSSTRSEFQMTSESLRIKFENDLSSARSEFHMTSESLRIKFESDLSSTRSEFQMSAQSIRMALSGVTDSNGNVTAASIALAINDAGEGVATINASKIYLLGQTIANQITADYIASKIATLSSLTVAALTCTGTIGANELQVGTLKFRTSAGAGYSFSDLKDLFVTSVEITGPVNNVYTLKYHTANNAEGVSGGTFSRAVSSFTGTWSGNHYQVTVSPQNQTGGDTYLFTSADDWTADHKKTVHVYYFSGSDHVDVLTPVIDAGSIYTAGDAASGAAASRHGSGYNWDFTITRGDGTTKTLTIDCSSIYSDARSGYTQGIFTPQTITLQGSQTSNITTQGAAATTTQVTLQGSATSSLTLQGQSQTVYEEVSSGGTVYYTAGTAVTVYPGDGGSFTVQGSAYGDITPIGSPVWFKQHSKTETPTGTWYTYHTSDPGGTTYKRFAAGAVIKGLRNAGTTTKYARGTGYSITPIGSTSKRLNAVTRYKEGTNVGVLYNAGSVATYYPATEILYKAGTNIGKLFNAGTISNNYYTKS